MSEQAIFRVMNHHSDACGTPPAIDDSVPDRYLGYFENEHGEQAIFVYDRLFVGRGAHYGQDHEQVHRPPESPCCRRLPPRVEG